MLILPRLATDTEPSVSTCGNAYAHVLLRKWAGTGKWTRQFVDREPFQTQDIPTPSFCCETLLDTRTEEGLLLLNELSVPDYSASSTQYEQELERDCLLFGSKTEKAYLKTIQSN